MWTAAIVTSPVLSVASAAKLRTLFELTVKSAAVAGATGVAATVTVNGVADGSGAVAVTTDSPPFSSIERGVKTNSTLGFVILTNGMRFIV